MNAEVFLKATKVDGVYDCDPMKHPDTAKRYDKLSYRQVSLENLQVGGSVRREGRGCGIKWGRLAWGRLWFLEDGMREFYIVVEGSAGPDLGRRICRA